MRRVMTVVLALTATTVVPDGTAVAGPASGTVKSATGTITLKHAVAYVVRDGRNARQTRVEVLLTDVPVDGTAFAADLDPHVMAINAEPLRDRNYLLLWISPDGSVSMNATYSETMRQYLNDSAGGLKSALTTNTPAKVEGRVFSASPLKTMDGPTYTVDVTFSADVLRGPTGTPLPAAGGEPGKAFMAFVGVVGKKNWNGIKAAMSPRMLPMYDKSYNTPAENAEGAADILNARLPMTKIKVTGGSLIGETTAVLEVEGERFGSPSMSLVRMVKAGAVWQFDDSAPLGNVR